MPEREKMYIEDRNSAVLTRLNKALIDIRQSKEYLIGRKIKICLDLIKAGKFADLFGLIHLKLKKQNSQLKEEDFEYLYQQDYKGKIAVYTCIVGLDEKVPDPLFISKACDYFLITDAEEKNDSVWKKININNFEIPCKTANEINRYVKLHPHKLFPQYTYSLYIDGNICIVSDILPIVNQMKKEEFIALHKHDRRICAYREAESFFHIPRLKKFANQAKIQMEEYKKEGFPENFGLFENPIILRKHNDEECINLMNLWWKQLKEYSMRDQISLPYAMWKLLIKENKIHVLGNNVRNNPRFIQLEHK